MSRLAPSSAVLAALGLALCAAPAAAQVPGVDLPADPAAAGIPLESAISDQYQAIEQAVAEAVPAPPAPPAPAPEPAAPPPEPTPAAPATEQYHSETPGVSVTQDQPSNVNVSIRVNSPGDDGPVVQINNAGGSTVVQQVVEAVQGPPPASRPEPAERPHEDQLDESSGLPDDWEWVWTSACFGGAARAAAAVPGWRWRWSCDEDDHPVAPTDLVPDVPDPWTLVAEVVASTPSPPIALTSRPASPTVTAARTHTRARRRGAAAVAPTSASSGSPLAAPLVVATATVPSVVAQRVRDVARAVVQARPGPADGFASVPSPLGDPTALGANALGAVASVLLGLWLAVLTSAIVLVVPRLRRRRRSGPAWRLKRPPSRRLERPG